MAASRRHPLKTNSGRQTLHAVSDLDGTPGLEIESGKSLVAYSTFRIGGPAELYVEVASETALEALLAAVNEARVPFFLLGLGSNVLIPDEGLEGVVARLVGDFQKIKIEGQRVEVGAAVPLAQLARRLASQGLIGMEALSGFPSTVGGAVYMNAGCYGVEIKDVLLEATVFDRDGSRRSLTPSELEPSYRTTALQGTGAIVTRASFQLQRGDSEEALAQMSALNRRRRESLPSGDPNVGSIFRNPPGDFAGRLIDSCGLKGARCGGAQISPRHGNVIVNTGGARALDVLELMFKARQEVGAQCGVWLEPEVVLAGRLGRRWQQLCEAEAEVN